MLVGWDYGHMVKTRSYAIEVVGDDIDRGKRGKGGTLRFTWLTEDVVNARDG
jgi:hypothetical protein